MAIPFGFSMFSRSALFTVLALCSSGLLATPRSETGTTLGIEPGPGNLRFFETEVSGVEGIGTPVILRVERLNGSQGSVSVVYRTSEGSADAGQDYTSEEGTLNWSDGDSQTKIIVVRLLDDLLEENDETFSVLLSNPTGGATITAPSTATVTIVDDDDLNLQPGQIRFVSTQFAVSESQGQRTIAVERTGGTDGPVTVNYATSDGSAVAGADYVGSSGTLQWADGQGGSMTFVVEVLADDAEEDTESVSLNLSDPTGGATLGTSAATLSILDDDGEVGDCVEDGTTMCLRTDQRFRVQANWRTAQGGGGPARVIPFGPTDSGLFYFFEDDNAEVLVKVLDGCAVNGHYWVFVAAATDVEYTLTVTDTQTSQDSVYTNALGTPAPAITDTTAFATCP